MKNQERKKSKEKKLEKSKEKKSKKSKSRKMFTITTRNIDSEFVLCFIVVNKINYSDLQLAKNNNWTVIKNYQILNLIQASYRNFLSSGLSLEDFFQCQIVPVRKTRGNQLIIETNEIIRYPIFIITDRKKRVQHGALFDQMNSSEAIKMPIELIFAMHGKIYPGNVTAQNCPEDVEVYTVCNGQAVQTPDCSGRSKCENVLLIGHDGENHYWLPNRSLVQGQFKCTKYPGKCLYKTNRSDNYKRHMGKCTDETTITSKQVRFNNHVIIT